jgi:hypothetical protein
MMDVDLSETSGTEGPDRDGAKGRAVFVTDFVHVAAPFESVVAELTSPSFGWLERLNSCDAVHRIDDGCAEATVRMRVTRRRGQMPVAVVAGPVRMSERYDRSIIVPIRWRPRQFSQLLPAIEADLVATELDDSYSRLGFSGRYRAPLGEVGASLDRMAMHRVAESTVRQFLHDVEQALSVS